MKRHSFVEQTFGIWQLRNDTRNETLKVRAKMSTNDGEIALSWALSGYGLILRSQWSVQPMINEGKLCRVLSDWYEPADVYAVYPTQDQLSAKTRAFIDFIAQHPLTAAE